jgi:tripartite-type tricarboxylate transporter receptor subunit TctC
MLKLVAAVSPLLVLAGLPAGAQDWPAARPIKIIVPYPPGGSTDVVARLVSDFASKRLGQSMVVENQAGASGNIGIAAAAKSAPDGYTLLVAPDSIASSPHVFKINYEPVKDFEPIVQLTRQPVVLAIHPSLEAKTVAEFVKLAKGRADLSFVSSGVGSQQHMVGEWFAKLAGIKMVHVAYRGGGQAINDLVAGHVKVGSLGSTPVIPHHNAGALRIIAQSTKSRGPGLSAVPTYGEAGFPDIILDQWLAVFAPAKTPTAILDRLNKELNAALGDEQIKKKLEQSALEGVGGTRDALDKLLRQDLAKYERLVKELGIKAQ